MTELMTSKEYRYWIVAIKQRVHASRIKAAISVNRELLEIAPQAVAQFDPNGKQLVSQIKNNAVQLVSQIPARHNKILREKQDSQVRMPEDGPSIGILICKSKSNITVEYSLRDLNKPIGVSEYQITENLPEQLRSSLPSTEQIEAELGGLEDE